MKFVRARSIDVPGVEQGGPTCVTDRRRSRRDTVVAPAMLDGPGLVRPVRVALTNLSFHGVGFRSSSSLDARGQYALRCDDRAIVLTTGTVRIISCRHRPDGSYDVGAEFC